VIENERQYHVTKHGWRSLKRPWRACMPPRVRQYPRLTAMQESVASQLADLRHEMANMRR